ncbi:hypothetical protein ACOSP6_11860 [Tenacibaculum sp. MEBiC06402]|uniref:hypothetical protein n=1 Tax=unclassified Tenacibaculum TaxID=2635139 RepID=UPI003B9A1BC6
MLIFFGTRSPLIGSSVIRKNVSCNYCNVENNLSISVYGSYFHVFWIPIMSFGRTVEVTCLHCKKTYQEKEIPNDLKPVVDTILQGKTMKSPKWHSLGCFSIEALFIIVLLMTFYALTVNAFKNSKNDTNLDAKDNENIEVYKSEEDIYREKVKAMPEWKKDLRNIMFSSLTDPSIVKKPISYNLKNCLEPKLPFIEEYSISYITQIKEDKILILIEAPDYNSYTEDQKKKFYNKIDFCINSVLKDEFYKRYVGIYKSSRFIMQQTPSKTVKDSVALKSDLLKEFFE